MKVMAYGVVGSLFIYLKFWYRTASAEALAFILFPVKEVIEWTTGNASTYQLQEGYLFRNLDIIISKSCSGFNFMLICGLMLLVLMITRSETIIKKAQTAIALLLFTYLVTLLANCSRIICSIKFQHLNLNCISEDRIHSAIGIFTYFSFLVATYILVESILIKKSYNADTTSS